MNPSDDKRSKPGCGKTVQDKNWGPRYCVFYQSHGCPMNRVNPRNRRRFPARNSALDFIHIPAEAMNWELSKFAMSARLEHLLRGLGCEVMGDLHGFRLSDLIRRRNCGIKSLQELMQLIVGLQQGNWNHWRAAATGPEDYYEI